MSKITVQERYGFYSLGEHSTQELERALQFYTGEEDHIVYRLRNGYGVSIIVENKKWNVAVIKYYGRKATEYNAVFDTPITDFVILTDVKEDIIDMISQLRDMTEKSKKLGLEVIEYFKSIPIPDRKVYY